MSTVNRPLGRAPVPKRVRPYLGLVGLLAAILLAGIGIERWVGAPAAVLEPYRLFFQLIVAGIVLSLLQNEVGLSTYGLFGPMIIAFILVAAGPLWGLALFLNVFVVTLVAYFAVAPLDLGTAPRVATLLTVACLATMGTRLLADLGHLPALFGGAAISFPVVISAWYAERLASDVEERGWTIPAVQFLWTILAIVVAFLLVTSQLVDWFMGEPVAWAGALGALVYVSSRPTFRLSEFVRFDGHIADDPALAFGTALQVRVHNSWARVAGLLGRDVERASVADLLPKKVRNQYIDEYNPEHARPAADRKAELKARLNDLDIEAPETSVVARGSGDLDAVRQVVEARDEFVLKPSQGYGGEGVLIASRQGPDQFETNDGPKTTDQIVGHARCILDGDFAGLEPTGEAIVEEKLVPSPFFQRLCGDGIPDIRVIVFQGFPVMTMTRLPTEASGGAANLHQGGVGVGLDVADGTPLRAYQQTTDQWLEAHPDTGAALTEFQVPNWEQVLDTAVRATAATGLGYAGVDIVLDENERPRVLEVNVRPGLGIQNTTGEGILGRLRFVEDLPRTYEFCSPAEKVTLAREWTRIDWDCSPPQEPTAALTATDPTVDAPRTEVTRND